MGPWKHQYRIRWPRGSRRILSSATLARSCPSKHQPVRRAIRQGASATEPRQVDIIRDRIAGARRPTPQLAGFRG